MYPELVGVVGSRVPDYRGIFLRGQGSQTNTHYGTVTHSSAALGQLQGDGIRTIWGTFVGGDWSGHDRGGSSGAFWPAGNAGVQEGDDYNQICYSFDVSRVTPVVGKVRPVCLATRGWRLGRGLRIASPPELTGDVRTHFTADPFRYKKRRQRRPRCVRNILCRLKKEGYSWHVAFPT